MNPIDRRSMLRDVLCGALVVTAAVATVGLTSSPHEAEAVPLAMEKDLAGKVDDLIKKAQAGPSDRRPSGGGPSGGGPSGGGPSNRRPSDRRRPSRRRRRWVCWWSKGRRRCGW